MSKKTKATVTVVFILGIIFLSFYRWLDHPLPQYIGEKRLPNLKSPVDVYTDPFGVPHVFAQNEEDLFFTAGYLAARERLFQLSMVALAVRGELASALGLSLIHI